VDDVQDKKDLNLAAKAAATKAIDSKES